MNERMQTWKKSEINRRIIEAFIAHIKHTIKKTGHVRVDE